MGKKSFRRAVRKLKKSSIGAREQVSGLLGLRKDGQNLVEVPGRNGFVYVRLRGNLSELIQAWNDAVSPVFNLPVVVERDRSNPNRYRIVSRDVGRYTDWGSSSAYLPKHGYSHSFRDDGTGGGDVAWIYSRQFMPGLVIPSGSVGALNAEIRQLTYYHDDGFHVVGGTGTADLAPYKPTGTSAAMVLVYIDSDTGNPALLAGPAFDVTVTGSADITAYLPAMPNSWDIPLAGIRLISGTSYIGWENIYDFREFLRPAADVPHDGEFVVMALNGELTNERRLVAGSGVSIADGGAGGNVTISAVGETGSFASLNDLNTWRRDQIFSPIQDEPGITVRRSSYQAFSNLQSWTDNIGNVRSYIDNDGYFRSEWMQVDTYDYPLHGLTGTYDHFLQDYGAYPANWTEVNAAFDTDTNSVLSYWLLMGDPTDTAYRYRRHALANYDSSTYVANGKWGTYLFGPLYFGAGNGAEDIHYRLGVYKDNGGVIQVNGYVRAHLMWDAANDIWKINGEEGDASAGNEYAYADHTGTYRTLAFPSPQPIWLSIHIHSHSGEADDLQSRVFVGTNPLWRTHEMIFDVVPTSVVSRFGQAWLEVEQTRGSGTAGTGDYLYLGAYDFLETDW